MLCPVPVEQEQRKRAATPILGSKITVKEMQVINIIVDELVRISIVDY